MMRQEADAAVLAEINITPFTDVLLVLLIIFMILAALVSPPGFERKVGCACSKPAPSVPAKQIAVTVTRQGGIFVDGKATGAAGLYGVLARMHARAPRDKMALYADAKAPYGKVIRVLDAAKAGGITDVSFVTE